MRRPLTSLTTAMLAVSILGLSARAQPLRVVGRHFVDPLDRVVVLRGVNLAGDSKVPPFLPIDDPRQLDPIPAMGFNCVRLVLSWEAIEPRPGYYNIQYLERMKSIAAECGARGLYVIVDVHQDGFSRYLSKGSGDGFPAWAASPRAKLHVPDNGPSCANWPIRMALDPGMHRSFADFYADTYGVRTRYLKLVRSLAKDFSQIPMVIGYDLINEPWGDERRELAPLYAQATAAIRAEHPSCIIFVEGHIATNMGLQTDLPRPQFSGVVYAPHYYKPVTIVTKTWRGFTGTIDRAFSHMNAKADEWCVPLFLGEFGAPAEGRRSGDYVSYLYARLDDSFASGAQWNYTPHWNPAAKDGWNGEDFNILDPSGKLRGGYRLRPHPRAISGKPVRFRYVERTDELPSWLCLTWEHRAGGGATEIFLPESVFPAGSKVTSDPPDQDWRYDRARQILSIEPSAAGRVSVRVIAR